MKKTYEDGENQILEDIQEIVDEMLYGGHLKYTTPTRTQTTDEMVVEQTMSKIIAYLVKKRHERKLALEK